jgi:hypothetical protein
MAGGRNGWLSGALFSALLGVLTWFAPFSDHVHSRKGRAVAAAFDAVMQPVIDAVGKLPVVAVFALAALFMVWRGLGLKFPGLSGAGLSLPRFRRERAEPEEEAEEPSAPRQRRRDLNRLALTDEGAHPGWQQSAVEQLPVDAEPSPDEEPAPPAHEEIASAPEPLDPEPPLEDEPAPEEEAAPEDEPAPAPQPAIEAEPQQAWENPFATDRAHAEYLAACHAFDKPIARSAMLQSYRTLVGPDAELSDALYEDVVARVLEQQQRTTLHGQRIDPVAIVRKPREKARDWTGDRSWLGGLPRLGEAEWPRGKDGKPLVFVAQIDLAEVAEVHPDTPLPAEGSLAFFIGSGAVVHVPQGVTDATLPPEDLPPAFGEDGHQLPERHSRVTHRTYPFWPVEPIRLRLPDGLPELPGPDDDDEAWDAFDEVRDAQVAALHAIVPPWQALATDGETIPAADMLWWYGANHVLRQLEESYDSVDEAVAAREKRIADAQAYQARLAPEDPSDEGKIAASKEDEERNREAIPDIRQQGEGLGEFIGHFEGFVSGKPQWDPMTGDEIAVLEEVLGEARRQFPDLCGSRVPMTIKELRAICIRRMITGDAAAVAALPDDLLAWLNARDRLATGNQHQMFGVGGSQQGAMYEHLSDHLLLQLGFDEIAELGFGDMGIWQFWLSPEDFEARRWDKAVLTFEMG